MTPKNSVAGWYSGAVYLGLDLRVVLQRGARGRRCGALFCLVDTE